MNEQWQPIQTASKRDGLEILTWDGASMRVASWAFTDNWWVLGLPSFKPTHWMPLPEPPRSDDRTNARGSNTDA